MASILCCSPKPCSHSSAALARAEGFHTAPKYPVPPTNTCEQDPEIVLRENKTWRKDNASTSHLFCTGINDQAGAGNSMENKVLMKREINPDSHPKAYSHAARMEPCYTITPASFSFFAAQPHNCGCIAHQACLQVVKGKSGHAEHLHGPLHTPRKDTRAIIHIVSTTYRAPSASSLKTQSFKLKITSVNQYRFPG